MRTTRLPAGLDVPVLGQATWYMAENRARRKQEVEALRAGIDLGMTLIDTAEMYADGEAFSLTDRERRAIRQVANWCSTSGGLPVIAAYDKCWK